MTEPDASKPRKSAERERKIRLLIALLLVLLSVGAVAPFFFMGRPEPGEENSAPSGLELSMPTTHDMFLHFDQMKSFYVGLEAGEIYPRWEEDTNHGFGAPTTSYYPPGVYYITSAFYALTGEWLRALLDAQLLMMIASAMAMYVYCRQSMTRIAACLATSAYIFLPYHLIDQYQRGAIAELLGFVWMPLMLLFAERLMEMGKTLLNEKPDAIAHGWKSQLPPIAGLGLAYGLFLWSHPPTAYQFSLSFGLYVGLLALMRREWKGVIRVGAGIGLGMALSAAYMLPAAVEQELIRHEYVSESWPYHNTYVFVHDLYNKEVHRDFFARIDGIWVLVTVVIVVAGLALLARGRGSTRLETRLRQRVIACVTVGLFVTFMMTRYSEPIGKHIPKIDIGVFTWRMLAISTLVVALLAGWCMEAAIRAEGKPRNERVALGLLGVLILLGGLVFSVSSIAWPMIRAPFFVPEEQHINYAIIPRTAPADPDELPDDVPQAELESGLGTLTVSEWKPEHRVIKVDLTQQDKLLIRTFVFPGWRATIDGKAAPIAAGDELGEIEIDAPAGAHVVELNFLNTRIRNVGSIITIAATFLMVSFFVAGGLKPKPASSESESGSEDAA
jgi:4-amino-4-deoxy-L-arabinose transferase-like glycosyltransferase